MNKQLFSVAPMLDWTTRHCRAFHRKLSQHATLYSEMVTLQAIAFSSKDQLFFREEEEGAVILQVGGSDPQLLKEACLKANNYPYAGINLNLGCPSPKVQQGSFGACLMLEPELVAQLCAVMLQHSKHPVSVKLRIGVDDQPQYLALQQLVAKLQQLGVKEYIVHARKAWLKGLSPKENREIPPLEYDQVYRLKQQFPDLTIAINGGINDFNQIKQHLTQVDGVMLGRQVWTNPQILLEVDQQLFQQPAIVDKRSAMQQALIAMLPYWQQELEQGTRLNHLLNPLFGAFHAQPKSSYWKQQLQQLNQSKLEPAQALTQLEKLLHDMLL